MVIRPSLNTPVGTTRREDILAHVREAYTNIYAI